jgi:hypothetical protein
VSDEGLRELEGRYRKDPTREHERDWIVGRLRAGVSPRERVRLAARFGYPPARAALDQDADLELRNWMWTPRFKTWARKVRPLLDPESTPRLGLSAALRTLSTFERLMSGEAGPRRALQAVATWVLAAPADRPDLATAVGVAVEPLDELRSRAARELDDGGIYCEYLDAASAASNAVGAVLAAARTVTGGDPISAALDAVQAAFDSSNTGPHRAGSPSDRVRAACWEGLLASLSANLVPWLCGTHDPVQEWLDLR